MPFELNQNVIDNIPKLISLLEAISKENEDMDQFYDELLKTAIKIVPEADYGSLIMIIPEKNSWTWLATVGHNKNLLCNMTHSIKAKNLKEGLIFVDGNIIEKTKDNMSEYSYKIIKRASTPIKQTMAYHMKITEKIWMEFTLDIDANSNKTFSEDSINILKLFGYIAKIFLKNKLEKNKLNELNKELKFKNYQLLEINKKIQKMYNNVLEIISDMTNNTYDLNSKENLLVKGFKTLIKIIPFVEKALLCEKNDEKIKILEKVGFENLILKELNIKEINNNIVEFIELSEKYIQIEFDRNTYIYFGIENKEYIKLFEIYNINRSLENLIHAFSNLNKNLRKHKEFTKE